MFPNSKVVRYDDQDYDGNHHAEHSSTGHPEHVRYAQSLLVDMDCVGSLIANCSGHPEVTTMFHGRPGRSGGAGRIKNALISILEIEIENRYSTPTHVGREKGPWPKP